MNRLTQLAETWILGALNEYEDIRDDIIWDVSLDTYPDPTNLDPATEEASFVPFLVLYLELPITKTESAYAAPLLLPYCLTEKEVAKTVRATVATLKSKKEAVLLDVHKGVKETLTEGN